MSIHDTPKSHNLQSAGKYSIILLLVKRPALTRERQEMKTYGVAITAGGREYFFHVDTALKVKELVEGSTDITALKVTEETSDYTNKTYRTMTDAEILQTIFLENTARTIEEKALAVA